MRRILTTLLTSGLIVALITPATLAAAGDRDGAGPAGTTAEPSVVASARPMTAVPAVSIRASIDRAVATMLKSAPVAAAQGPAPTTRRGKTAIRAQGGGGGKTGMIIGLVSTLVGVAATVYMVREMQKQQVDENK